MKRILIVLLLIAFVAASTYGATSISSIVSPSIITQGETTVVTATVSATGQTETNVQVQISVPSGLSVSGSELQVISSIAAGSSESVSWNVTGDVASESAYTITTSIVGGSSSQAYLTVNSPALISTSDLSCSKTTMGYSDTADMTFTVRNEGGTSTNAQVNVSATRLRTISGDSSWSADINGGGSAGLTYSFTGSSSNCGTATITAAITSNANNPDDLSCTLTITGCSEDGTGGAPPGEETPQETPSGGGPSAEGIAEAKTESLRSATISKATSSDIDTILSEGGLDSKAIEKAIAALDKTTVSKSVEVEKSTNAAGVVSYKTTITFSVANLSSKKMKNVSVIEKIPKSVISALSESDIKTEYSFEIVKADPIVRFMIDEIDEMGTVSVVYSIAREATESAIAEFSAPIVESFEEEEVDRCRRVRCDDDNPCTSDSCNSRTGRCRFTELDDGTHCGEGKECREGQCITPSQPITPIQPTAEKEEGVDLLSSIGRGGAAAIAVIIIIIAALLYFFLIRKPRKPLTYKGK